MENSYSDSEEEFLSELLESNKEEEIEKPKKKGKKLNIKKEEVDNFLEYLESYKTKNKFINTENSEINSFDFTIDKYSTLTDKNLNSLFKASKESFLTPLDEKLELINSVTAGTLFQLITSLIKIGSNILIYGLGSKLEFIYEYLKYFQEKVSNPQDISYHILVFNCYNSEITLKSIVKEITRYLDQLCETRGKDEYQEEKQSRSKPRTTDDTIKSLQKNYFNYFDEYNFKILLVLNNIDSHNLGNKNFQRYLSNLCEYEQIIVLATCDCINLPMLWTQNIKETFKFYFLKFSTLKSYDVEINDLNSLYTNKGIKSGVGLVEILKSFTKQQKAILKELAKLQLKEDYEKMTSKGIIEYFTSEGKGICDTQARFFELILEAKDHEIVSQKMSNKINKEIFILNLDKEVLEKLAKGEYDNYN